MFELADRLKALRDQKEALEDELSKREGRGNRHDTDKEKSPGSR